MTFSEAIKQKKNILRNTSEFTKTLYDYVIIPALEEESKKYMDKNYYWISEIMLFKVKRRDACKSKGKYKK